MRVIFKARRSGGWPRRRPNDKYLDSSPCFESREPLRAQVRHRARDHPCQRLPPVSSSSPRRARGSSRLRDVERGAWGVGGAAPPAYAADVALSAMNAAAMSASRMLEDLGHVVGLIALGVRQRHRMEVEIQLETAAEALDHRHGAGLAGRNDKCPRGERAEGEQCSRIHAQHRAAQSVRRGRHSTSPGLRSKCLGTPAVMMKCG